MYKQAEKEGEEQAYQLVISPLKYPVNNNAREYVRRCLHNGCEYIRTISMVGGVGIECL
jgi:hypothetical protein